MASSKASIKSYLQMITIFNFARFSQIPWLYITANDISYLQDAWIPNNMQNQTPQFLPTIFRSIPYSSL
jgi:hypothetical protein